MATYYRWRRSTVDSDSVLESEVDSTYSAAQVDPGEYALFWYGNSYTINGDSFNISNRQTLTVPIGTNKDLPELTNQYFAIGHATDPDGSGYGMWTHWLYKSSGNLSISWTGTHYSVTSDAILYKYNIGTGPGTFIDYVYSTSSSAYPNGGVSGGYYYDQRTTVTSPTAPTGLTYPNPITTPKVTVSWNAATSNVPNVTIQSYHVVYILNGSPVSGVVGDTSGTSIQFNVPVNAQTLQFELYARDSNGQSSTFAVGPTVNVYLSPTLTVPSQLMQGQQATISWSAISGADSYTLQRKANTDTDWTQVYSGGNTTFSETAGTWTSVQYRVQAVFSGTAGGWATSASIPVISASALVISGSDGDLGTVVNDIPYTISSDTGNQITATISVNSAVIFSGNVGNSTAGTIPVLDLVNGTGTIVIEASVQATSGTVSAVRTWTYTKAEITFPNAGSVAQLTQQGANIWPKTLAECVRLPGGKTLDEVLESPCQVYAGSYVGTGTYGEGNPNELTFPFKPLAVFVNSGNSGATIPFIRSGTMSKNSSATLTVTWSGGGISWTSNNAANQLNTSGVTYYVFAIGIAAEPGVFLETPQYAESGSVVWNFSIPSGIEIPESGAVNVTVTMTRDGDTPTWTNGRYVTYAVDGADGGGTTAEALIRSSADEPAPTFTIQITNATQKAVYIRITNVSQ